MLVGVRGAVPRRLRHHTSAERREEAERLRPDDVAPQDPPISLEGERRPGWDHQKVFAT